MIRGALIGVLGRELKRLVRQRARLVSTFARPLIWLLIIGSGFSAIIPGGQFSYHKFLLPGIIGMVLLFSSLLSALGSVHDREFGSMRMLLIAPVPRGLVVLGKTLSATLTGAVFALVLSPLVFLFEAEVSVLSYVGFFGAVLLTAFALSSLGMLVASRMRTLENFAVAMNFVIFPMFFLSGALYPTEKLPEWMQAFVRVNPLTYGVDLMRHTLLAAETEAASHIEYTPAADIGFLVAFSLIALTLAMAFFGGEEHLAPMFLARVPKSAPLVRRLLVWLRLDGRHLRSSAVGARLERASGLARRLRRSSSSERRPLIELRVRAGPVEPLIRGAVIGVVKRELKRAVRQRGRLASTFARPLLWLVVVGAGFAAIVPGGQYHKYLLPGIIGMSILFSSLLAALASVHDREFGPMRMLMVAPVPRGWVVLGKTISAALLSTIFALILSPLAFLFNIEVTPFSYLEFVGAVLLCSLALSALGMLIASWVRQLENFTVAMNFVIFPLFFLSGALYPAENLPVYLQPFVRLNPLTYGVDLMRHTLLINLPWSVSPLEFKSGADIAYLAAFTLIALALAIRLFGREQHLSAMLLSGAPRQAQRVGLGVLARRLRLAGAPSQAAAGAPASAALAPVGGPVSATAPRAGPGPPAPAESLASASAALPAEDLKTVS